MVNGINSTSTSYWLQLLSSQKNQSSGSNSLSLAGMMDTAEISGQGTGMSGMTGHTNPLEQLITDGAITQEQADSVKSALDAGRPRDFMSGILDNLVSDGTLTQEEADAVASSMKQGMQGPPPPPPEESSSSTTSQRSEPVDPLDSLVSSGVITQEQEDAIKSALKTAMDTIRAMKAYSL